MLRRGSRGPEVSSAQAKINIRNPPSPRLAVDGIFGSKTDAATKAFQSSRGLQADGIIGPLTQAKFNAPTPLIEANHAINLIPQPTTTTCWAASTAMMTRSNVPLVIRRTPPDMIASDGGLLNSSGSDQAIVTGTRYGNIHGLRCYAPMSWTTSAFVALIQRGPIMLDMLWNTTNYAAGNGSPGHMVVISGVISDGAAAGSTTYVKVLDPWRPNQGKISYEQYDAWMRDVPTRTYRVFERR